VTLFINYFRSDSRSTCLNLAIARFVLCLYGAWKIASASFCDTVLFPADFLSWKAATVLDSFRWSFPQWMAVEQVLTVLLLLLCAVGAARAVSSFGAALLTTHMAGLAYAFENEKSVLNLAFFLIFYGIFRKADTIALDSLFSDRRSSLATLNDSLKSRADSQPVRLEALKWFLLALALVYFFTGFSKWQAGDWTLAWGSWENIRLAILNNGVGRTLAVSPLGEFLIGQPVLLSIAGYGTLFLELGFLPAVLAGLSITPFLVSLAGMHAVILLAMDVNYLTDMVFFYAAFFAWDSLAGRLQRGQKLLIVYDDQCAFCARMLVFLKGLWVSGDVRFVGPADPSAPHGYDYANAIFVFDGAGNSFRGYDGIVRYLSFAGLTKPLAWVMSLPPLTALGKAAYAWVARNRSCV